MEEIIISEEEINALYERLNKQAQDFGYHLNPNEGFSKNLIKGLLINEKRYGYWACPCRLAVGKKEDDLDIICPCDYRDLDLNDYGQCYCALYVSKEVLDGKKQLSSIAERRTGERKKKEEKPTKAIGEIFPPVWRCRVCGYLCARENPPEVCPICKAKKDRFERFL
jgi:ferredoxin-thioredoxin reductase catalytic subunit